MPELRQSPPNVCGFLTMYAAFHIMKYRQDHFTKVHDVEVFSFIVIKTMSNFDRFNVNVQVKKRLTQRLCPLVNFEKTQ